MREIKFRAWVKSEKCFIQHQEVIERSHLQFNDDLGGHNDIVMQYTGLKDKNGREIFEGDIILFKYHKEDIKAEVVFKMGTFCISLKEGSYPLCEYIHQELEIIGNKFENPELLK